MSGPPGSEPFLLSSGLTLENFFPNLGAQSSYSHPSGPGFSSVHGYKEQ